MGDIMFRWDQKKHLIRQVNHDHFVMEMQLLCAKNKVVEESIMMGIEILQEKDVDIYVETVKSENQDTIMTITLTAHAEPTLGNICAASTLMGTVFNVMNRVAIQAQITKNIIKDFKPFINNATNNNEEPVNTSECEDWNVG